MPLSVAILGRPNVGKSTLFNRLVGKRLAIVHDTPGVTRDWRSAPAEVGGIAFIAIDTAGLEEADAETLEGRMRAQTEQALAQADVALLVIDARAGVTPLDHHFAAWLRRTTLPVVLIANKCESRAADAGLIEGYELGLGEPVPISAEHGEGMADLVEALLPHIERVEAEEAAEEEAIAREAAEVAASEDGAPADPAPRIIQLAVVGRPNAGKSTLVNALIGEDRLLAGPEPGMTRDAISIDWTWKDRPIRLVDTAGLRRKARIEAQLEKLAVDSTLRAVRLAQVVILVVDGALGLDRQDLVIARHVIDEGRALVVAVNKWDAVEDRQATMKVVRDRLEASLAQVRGVPVVTCSGLKGQRLDRIMDAVVDIHGVWDRRVATGPLNRWLQDKATQHPPPLAGGRPNRLRYITQIKARPPTFACFVSQPEEIPETYVRYLINGLREDFDIPGVPVRLYLRRGRNPYAPE